MASQPQRSAPEAAGGGGGGGEGGGRIRRSFLPAPKRTSGIPTPSSSIPAPTSSIPTFNFQAPASTAQLTSGRTQKAPAEVSKGSPVKEKTPQEVIPGAENLRVGEKIRISGVKPGILRFVGRTHIAPGFWCGIELYDASGLHDGEVDGQRYFTCKPFRGIFAPVDKVIPDESPPVAAVDEKRPQVGNFAENREKAGTLQYSSRVSDSGKFQSGQLSGLARGEAGGEDRGGLKSATGDSTYRVSAFNIRRHGDQEAEAGHYKSRVSSTYGESQDTDRAMSSEEAEGYSRHVKEHLQSDSRRYFNLTFGRDTPPLPHSNLPDLLSSVSPPTSQDETAEDAPGQHHQSREACNISDIQLEFKEGGPDGATPGSGLAATSESDPSLSGHSSSLEEASVATVMEVVRGEPKAGEDSKVLEASRRSGCRSPVGKDSVDQTADDRRKISRHKRRTSSTSGTGKGRAEGELEDGSNEVSPEVSQVLEWDYDHDAFDGLGSHALKVGEASRDLNREDAARQETRHSTDKPVYDEESEESEEEESEEEEETSEEEETTSEEESEEEDDEEESEEEEETEEEESEEEESEDDRIEADRNGPHARSSVVTTAGSQDGRVAPPVASSNQNQAMSGSVVVGNEMTESMDTPSTNAALPETSSQKQTGSADNTTSKTKDGPGSGSSKQKTKKKKSTPNSAEDKKIVAEHKKAVKAASSRLADYIKAPLPPPKRKEEKEKKAKDKEKKSSKTKKKDGKGGGKTKEEKKEEKKERRQPRIKEEKPKVKRTVVKSKWGNIMSQIEASKSTVKIKPKAEIQSSLAAYLSTPVPPNPKKDADNNADAKEAPKPAKPKPKLIKHPKPDFSNIKSKLNITPPAPLPRRDSNATNGGKAKSPGPNSQKGLSKASSPTSKGSNLKDPGKAVEARSRNNVSRKPPVPKFNAKEAAEKKQEFLEKETAQSQRTGSCSSVFAADGNTVSRAGARLRSERASSATSTKSDASNAQRSVKSMNQRNVQKTEQQSTSEQQDKKTTAKTSPSGPRKASIGLAVDPRKNGDGERGAGSRASSSPPKATAPSRPAWGTGAARAAAADQNRAAKSKSGPGLLKSGHPPDVVSTSARGSRAQEVARLESLCEARTKELNYTRMQLKAGLQAFDAMACLLNYCTTELDAFSCPTTATKLKAATDKLTEQQHSLDLLTEEKKQWDQQLQQVTEAKDAAQQEVERLKQEMQQAEEAHSAAQQKLQEEQSAALKALKGEITSQHQETLQQMQKYQENQSEYTRQSHKRQLVELTSEHQMATNQLKVAHLEDIQALRNKHELQVEELHVQHRKKLEDITERFESIKLSLTEKVQSLCGECDDLRIRAKSSEEALQRDSDVKVQLALTPYMHLPKEIESLKTVIDMRTEEIQKLRRQNMDLVKQLEELPIVQEKVVSLQQKVENLQAIINIKTDHEKQLHEKCQVLMRKYDRESKANKRLSMDYEQVVWRMSQSADFSGSMESISPRQLSRSPSRGEHHSHGSSPVRSLSSSSQGADSVNGVVQRQRKPSGGEESDPRRRANTFSDTPRHRRVKGEGDGGGLNGPGSGSSSGKRRVLSKSGDYSEMVSASTKEHEESFSSGHESGDTSDFFSSLESNVILETPQGVSFQLTDKTGRESGSAPPAPAPSQDDVFMEEVVMLHSIQDVSPEETSSPGEDTNRQTEVTVVVTTPSSH